MLGAADRSYTTAGYREEQQFDAWRAIVADAFAPVELDSGVADAESGFAADCHVRGVGDIGVAWLRSGSQQVRRTAPQISSAPCGVYFLNFVLDSPTTVHQDGRTAHLRPGDFAVVDGDRPFELDYAGDFEQISLTIPKAVLDPSLVDARCATALAVPGDRGIGAIAAAAFAGLALHAAPIRGRAAGSVAVHVVGLLAAALEASMPVPADRRTALFRAVLEDIESHYGDTELTLRHVARRVAISPSYLTKLFAENRTSFGRWLLSRRLDHAWIALAQAPWDGSIADVAMQCGFHDAGYFARAFRLRFGITPSERRRSSAPAASG
ncbi:helix-turn-helix domain-containing protein [Microbacterium sp.]|uniref:AraC-like ligand-binding domain-containing protein n=1 Tax=Microbacterium sp. TaxID=51671 RepID=UPI0028124EE4|nr:helix-turn-helix domain-containing protein [Microbacterium sp.]